MSIPYIFYLWNIHVEVRQSTSILFEQRRYLDDIFLAYEVWKCIVFLWIFVMTELKSQVITLQWSD